MEILSDRLESEGYRSDRLSEVFGLLIPFFINKISGTLKAQEEKINQRNNISEIQSYITCLSQIVQEEELELQVLQKTCEKNKISLQFWQNQLTELQNQQETDNVPPLDPNQNLEPER